jgi:hypothetical protein
VAPDLSMALLTVFAEIARGSNRPGYGAESGSRIDAGVFNVGGKTERKRRQEPVLSVVGQSGQGKTDRPQGGLNSTTPAAEAAVFNLPSRQASGRPRRMASSR